jgi:MYXO-CTERM domain-containing protein
MIWDAKAVKRISNCYLGRQTLQFEMSLGSYTALGLGAGILFLEVLPCSAGRGNSYVFISGSDVPEPNTSVLLGTGAALLLLAAIVGLRRRSSRRAVEPLT